jgi:hypothetical protein
MNWEIHPGVGLGELKFGDSQEQVKSALGEPEEIEAETEEGDETVTWYYWEQGVTAHFSESEDYKLGVLQIDNPEATLAGKKYIGLAEKELLAAIEASDWGEVEVDNDPDFATYTAWSKGVTFIVPTEDGAVASIQTSPLLDEDDNAIWPA